MIAPANPNEETPDESTGGLGGGTLYAKGTRDTRLIELALREGWPIPEKFRRPVVRRQVRIAIDPASSPREATSAAKCIAMMSAKNADIALKLLDKVIPDRHEVNHTVEEIQAIVEETCRDETYVRLQRQRAAQHGLVAGSNGHNGHAGPMADGEAPDAG